jgi:SsrA-binding protein
MYIQNRKARHEYFILEEFTAGISLLGTEVKSIRLHNANINDSFVYISNNEIFIKGMYIGKYQRASDTNHTEVRDRKLLLRKKEIRKISKEILVPGITCIPLEVFESDGYIKIRIGIAKGKTLWNKKESIKEKDIKLQTQRELSYER